MDGSRISLKRVLAKQLTLACAVFAVFVYKNLFLKINEGIAFRTRSESNRSVDQSSTAEIFSPGQSIPFRAFAPSKSIVKKISRSASTVD